MCGTEERRYNNLLRRTRNLIEIAFGVLKSWWRILDHSGGGLCCYKPKKVCKISVTCCVLHNICRRNWTSVLNTLFDPGIPELLGESTNPTPLITESRPRQRERVVATIGS